MAPSHRVGRASPDRQRVRRRVRDRAAGLGLKVSFGDGRRATDVTLVVVKGQRATVMRSYPLLFEGLGLDLEVVRATQTPDAYEVVMALMVPRPQRPKAASERRASEIGGGDG